MKKDIAGTLLSIGEMGYKYLETAGYGNGLVYRPGPDEHKNLCTKSRLQILVAHTRQVLPTKDNCDKQWLGGCVYRGSQIGRCEMDSSAFIVIGWLRKLERGKTL